MNEFTYFNELYKIVKAFKQEHPGVLEARTAQRKTEEKRKQEGGAGHDRLSVD